MMERRALAEFGSLEHWVEEYSFEFILRRFDTYACYFLM